MERKGDKGAKGKGSEAKREKRSKRESLQFEKGRVWRVESRKYKGVENGKMWTFGSHRSEFEFKFPLYPFQLFIPG